MFFVVGFCLSPPPQWQHLPREFSFSQRETLDELAITRCVSNIISLKKNHDQASSLHDALANFKRKKYRFCMLLFLLLLLLVLLLLLTDQFVNNRTAYLTFES